MALDLIMQFSNFFKRFALSFAINLAAWLKGSITTLLSHLWLIRARSAKSQVKDAINDSYNLSSINALSIYGVKPDYHAFLKIKILIDNLSKPIFKICLAMLSFLK